ncbi:MAG TPA: hypothetical protein EYO09_03290, partial [Candidatus Poseidoniales archaeon]|nr:hypothetical protein [Candidatus Poseidoniales archaeon]
MAVSGEHYARSGPLVASLLSTIPDIDDDDRDVLRVRINVDNESAIPMGGLEANVITSLGRTVDPVSGVSSIGPGLSREYEFAFALDSGHWTFNLQHDATDGRRTLELGSYAADFEFDREVGRSPTSAVGSTLFSGVFDSNLDDFGQVNEREIIDPGEVMMVDYNAEHSAGGGTMITVANGESTELPDLAPISESSSGLTTASGDRARPAPPISKIDIREAPPTSMARTEEPILAHDAAASSTIREAPPTPPSGPPTAPPSPPSGPPMPPSGPPTTVPLSPPSGLLTGPPYSPVSDPLSSPVSDPLSSPVSDPLSSPVSDPLSSPVSDPLSSPVSDPLSSP